MDNIKMFVRVEHAVDGWGMFIENDCHPSNKKKCRKSVYRIDELGSLASRHRDFPTPILDIGIGRIFENSKNLFCGYKSIEQFREWVMPGEMDILIKNDFRVFLIEATEVTVGEFQVVFCKDSIVSKKDITEIFITTDKKVCI